MQTIVAAPERAGFPTLTEVDEPSPDSDAALLDVRAVSLNRGEAR